jgi:hypothetical protein
MSVCKPIYPEGTLKKDNFPQIPDFENLVRAWDDPTLRYDMEQVKVINTLNNALLLSSNLDDYPTLKERFEQGAITDEEYADFIFDSGNNPDSIRDLFLSDFPVQFDFNELTDLLGGVNPLPETFTPDPGNTGVTPNEGINNGLPRPTPSPVDPVDTGGGGAGGGGSPVIDTGSGVFDDFDTVPIDRFIPGVGFTDLTTWTPGPSVEDYLRQLDFYYAESYSAVINSGICKSFTNPFAKISSLIAAAAGLAGGISSIIDKVKSIVNKIKNFSIGSLIGDLAGKLQGLIDGAINAVINLKKQMLSKLKSLESSVANFVQNMGSGGQRIFEFFNRKIQQVKEFFAEWNMKKLEDKVKSILTMNREQFEDLLPAVINLLALKACGVTNFVDFLMQDPINRIKDLMDRTTLTFSIQESKSLIVTNEALNGGAVRINPRDRRIQSGGPNGHAATANRGNGNGVGSSTAITPTRYVTLPMSEEERAYVQAITSAGTPHFVFAPSVKSMGTESTNVYNSGGCGDPAHQDQWDPNQNYPDAGWKMIVEKNPFMYAGLKRVATKLQEEGLLSGPLLLNSCYRSPYYNRIVLRVCRGNSGAAWNSNHMSAMAIDISTNNLSEFGTAKLVKYCSQEGFNRLSVYNSFVHVDIQDGAYRGNWTANYRNNPDIRRAVELHVSRQHTEGSRA